MCVVFTFNRSFYSTSVHTGTVSVLILYPRDTNYVITDWDRKNKTTAINQGKASEMLAYLVREHNKTNQTRKIRKIRTKKTKKADRSFEECDERSERLHMCRRGTDNCCTGETTRRRGRDCIVMYLLYSTLLYSTLLLLYCTVLYCTVLYCCTVLCNNRAAHASSFLQHCTVLYSCTVPGTAQ